jgi:excisionase family DNA binding protein
LEEEKKGRELNVEEVAKRLGIKTQSVKRTWIASGRLKAHKERGDNSPWLVYEEDLNDFIKENRIENTKI